MKATKILDGLWICVWTLCVMSSNSAIAGSTDTSLLSSPENPNEVNTTSLTTVTPASITVMNIPASKPNTETETTTISSTTIVAQQNLSPSSPNESSVVQGSTNQPTEHTSPARKDNRYRNLNRAMVIVFTPLAAVAVLGLILGIGVYLRKKIRLDKLRHQLMPLYSFDPAAEDWETELLTEQRDINQVTTEIKSPSPTDSPKLKFSTETLEI